MEIYIHSAGREDPDLIEVQADARVRDLIEVRDGDDAELIWIEDGDEPIELDITVEATGLSHRHHAHRNRCRRVDVRVRFGGNDRSHDYAPSTTIGRIFEWATGESGFDLPAEQRPKHVLAVPGADHFLAKSVHIGSLVTAGSCDVVLDLDAKVRFEG
jgi:hypothetical protein